MKRLAEPLKGNMKVLLVGVGGVGEAIAMIAKERAWVDRLVLTDYNFDRANEVQRKLGDTVRFPVERVEPRDRFPHGLRTIADAVEKEGLRFLMWFEPERVVAGTFLAKEHPEWVISPSGDGGGLYHLGIPEARRFMTDYLDAAIKAYKLSCLRIDYNIDPLAFWRFMDAKDPNRVGLTENFHQWHLIFF